MAKKLIIKNNIKKLENLLNIFFVYFKENENKPNSNPSPYKFYLKHGLDPPDKEWIQFCRNQKIII